MAKAQERKLTADEEKELAKAQETILRLQGPPPAPDPAAGPPVLRRYRVLLHGVTWDQKTKQRYDNTCKAIVRDQKTGQNVEVVIDRAVVSAYNTADALNQFMQSWGITSSEFLGTVKFDEVRSLTENERLSPPEHVLEMPPHILVGVPAPKVFPIHAPPMHATAANMERWSQKTGLPIPEGILG